MLCLFDKLKVKQGGILLLIVLCVLLIGCGSNQDVQAAHDEWNNGYCSDCGGELIYKATGSHEHFVCEKCGKEYVFDRLMVKNRK
jgi:predicted RNA-binding Zn-ribbon protein involved in translation (DUF1610 family)